MFHALTLQSKGISETLMPGIPYQSRLASLEREIEELRRKRPPTPYRQVLRLLEEKHGVQISLHALYSFVQTRKKWDRIHRSSAMPLASSKGQSLRARVPIKAATVVPPAAGAAPARPTETLLRSADVPLLPSKPGGKTLKSFTPSLEYNLERLTGWFVSEHHTASSMWRDFPSKADQRAFQNGSGELLFPRPAKPWMGASTILGLFHNDS
jgi:hypothetical protein